MSEHPIEGLMTTAMNSIKDMIDVNTIIGEPIQAMNNTVIIPISKVTFGFAAGGSEFKGETIDEYQKKEKEEAIQYRLPFGGGSAAGVNISPEAFLVVQNDSVKLLEANHVSVLDKLAEYVPDVIEKISNLFKKDDDDWENKDEDSFWDKDEDEEDEIIDFDEEEFEDDYENSPNSDYYNNKDSDYEGYIIDENNNENKNIDYDTNEKMKNITVEKYEENSKNDSINKDDVEIKKDVKIKKSTKNNEIETDFKKVLKDKKNNKVKKVEGKIKKTNYEDDDLFDE